MKAVLCVCCETAILDGRTNELSLINLIDEVSAVAFPIAVAKLNVVTIFTRDEGEPDPEATVQVKLNDNSLFEVNLPIEFQGKMRTRSIGQFHGMVVGSPGLLRIGVYIAGEEVTGWDIQVRAVGFPPQADLFTVPESPTE